MHFFVIFLILFSFAHVEALSDEENPTGRVSAPMTLLESRLINLSLNDSSLNLAKESRNALTCGYKYFTQVFRLGKELFVTALEGRDVVRHFVKAFHTCRQNSSGFFACVSLSVSDAWEQNEHFRKKLAELSLNATHLFEDISNCLSPS